MAYGDIRNFVYRVIDIFPGPLKTPARWVADRVYGVWDEIFQLLTIFPPAWAFFYTGINALVVGVRFLGEEASKTLRWVTVEALPRWARWALNTAIARLGPLVEDLRTWAQGMTHWLYTLIVDSIDSVRQLLSNIRTWVIDHVREVWDTLSVIRDRVVALLTSPDVLVDWLFAALWRRLWQFFNNHAEAIAYAVYMRRDRIIAEGLRRLEEWLVKVL